MISINEKEMVESFAHFGRRMAEILEVKNEEIKNLKAQLAKAEERVKSLEGPQYEINVDMDEINGSPG